LADRAARAGVALTSLEIDQLEAYCRLLTRWNRTINLTAFQLEPLTTSTLDRLLIEPLAAARFVPDLPGRWIDLGSGGGSPAIPLKIVRPQWALTMVDARERKAAFLREAARDLALTGVNVLSVRFETLRDRPDLAGLQTLVTARAVRVDSGLLSLARWLLSPGGRLFLFGGHDHSIAQNAQFDAVEVGDLGVDGSSSLLILTARA
jgi:16S rRNA (guanine527-N7)-methyltransferase